MKMKNTFGELINKLDIAEEKSMILMKYQQKLPELKYMEKMNEKGTNNM